MTSIETDDREMPEGRPSPGRRCLYCHEIIMGFSCPDRRFCSETCILAHSEAHKRGFYAEECTRCGAPRSDHSSTVAGMNVQYFCPDDTPAAFDDFLGRTQRKYAARATARGSNGSGQVREFFSDEERAEMYRDSQSILEEGEERWKRDTLDDYSDERNADEI